MPKRYVLSVRQNAEWSSMSLGILFQTSGPETEKLITTAEVTCWTAFLSDRQRQIWWMTTVDDVCKSLTQNVMRSWRYGGELWWKMLCIIVAILNIIWNLIGSQWRCCRAGVMRNCRQKPRISWAAGFWTRWREKVLTLEVQLAQNCSTWVVDKGHHENISSWIMVYGCHNCKSGATFSDGNSRRWRPCCYVVSWIDRCPKTPRSPTPVEHGTMDKPTQGRIQE